MGDLAVHEVQKADKKAPFWVKLIYYVMILLVGIGLGCILPPSVDMVFIVFFPIFMSMLVMELLVWFKILDKNVVEDRALWNYAQKLLGILIAISMAIGCVLCGVYGSVEELGVGNAILKVVQLCIGGIIIIFLKEFGERYVLESKEISPSKTVGMIRLCLQGVFASVFIVFVVFRVYQHGIAATANLMVKVFTSPEIRSLVLLTLLALCSEFLKKSEKKKLM